MRNWDSLTNNDLLGNPTLDAAICSQEQDYNDALAVAERLGLVLHRVDFIKEYWDEVFRVFLKRISKRAGLLIRISYATNRSNFLIFSTMR